MAESKKDGIKANSHKELKGSQELIDFEKDRGIDWLLIVFLFAIMAIGAINLYSASLIAHSPFYIKQIVWYVAGCILMLITLNIDYRLFTSHATWLYWGTNALLLLVLFIGRSAGGSQRWLNLGLFNLQPSEFAKVVMVIAFAKHIYDNDKEIYGLKDLIKPAFLAAIPCALIIKQPDLGTAIMILIVLATMLFAARIKWTTLVGIFVSVSAMLPLIWNHLKPYQKRRIITFLDPEKDPFGSGYHVIQSKVAIGSGGIWGKGFMKGTQAHLNFLPEVHTDFAFSLWGEEWGFIGAITLLALYILVVYRGIVIAIDTNDRQGKFLAIGITAMFFWQAIVNMNMVMGLMPVVGVPLPLFSYGGSSVIVTLIGLGLLLSVGRKRSYFKA